MSLSTFKSGGYTCNIFISLGNTTLLSVVAGNLKPERCTRSEGQVLIGGAAGGAGGAIAPPPQFLPNFCRISIFCFKVWHFYAYSPLTFQLAPALSNSLRRLCSATESLRQCCRILMELIFLQHATNI